MAEKHLHIVSFDIPFPADYGGVIDVYYKLKALQQLDVNIHLHCFEYGRQHSLELEKICHSVHYYPRKKGISHLFSPLPYIVNTRSCKKLLEELRKDNYPILYEGLHTTAILHFVKMENRLQMVRMHNIEHDYYHHLGKASNNWLKKMFFKTESSKLKQYEKVLNKASQIFAISKNDAAQLQSKYKNVSLIGAFHPNNEIISEEGKGTYLLYHGNLSVDENERAATFLINEVFSQIKYPCVLAGKKPSKQLKKLAKKYPHIELVANPSKLEMKELISQAQINILPTFQATGIKLKLLESVALGRYILVNKCMIADTGLEDTCIIKDHADEMISEIELLMAKEFSAKEKVRRQEIWQKEYSNMTNAAKILKFI